MIGRRIIQSFMPEKHREFFNQLPFLIVASVDAEGRPSVSILFGIPGFVASVGAPASILGIELPTRRRNRLNAIVAAAEEGRIESSICRVHVPATVDLAVKGSIPRGGAILRPASFASAASHIAQGFG